MSPDRLPFEQLVHFLEHRLRDARLLLGLLTTHFADALAAVLVDDRTFDAREDLDVDHGALHPGRHLERRILHVLRLLAEDRGQQLLFRRQLGLALRRDLADEDVARLDVRADADDAALVEIDERLIGDVGDFAGDLFLAALGVANVEFEFLDVDRRIDVVLDQALGEDDRVFEVVAVPRHERDQHVRAERQFAVLGGRAVGDDLPGVDLLPCCTSGR